jgi:hypothetical protein
VKGLARGNYLALAVEYLEEDTTGTRSSCSRCGPPPPASSSLRENGKVLNLRIVAAR